MEGKRLLLTLRLDNVLSYGPEGTEIELQPLNVLIGPNGSGKSNLIEAISLLKAAPTDISAPIRAGGGMPEWICKGGSAALASDFRVGTTISYPHFDAPIHYYFRLTRIGQSLELGAEQIQHKEILQAERKTRSFLYNYTKGSYRCEDATEDTVTGDRSEHRHKLTDVDWRKSILAQRRDPENYPVFTYLANVLNDIHLFRAVTVGYDSPLRGPQRADEPGDFLAEDGRNLGMVLNHLLNSPPTKRRLIAELKRFYEPVEDITTRIVAGTVETFLHERSLRDSIPSVRLSDGTLRYLCLLTILCHPEPPPLVCIEDPEIGLHPDVLHVLGELMLEASQRTQLIITTHSDMLVSAFSETPEAVVVCERDNRGSHLRRLDAARLQEWLKKYSLGELWVAGELGGTL